VYYNPDEDGFSGATGDCGCEASKFPWGMSEDEYYDMLNDDD
jgi:hypothetical protein